jgi:hypothetical protein
MTPLAVHHQYLFDIYKNSGIILNMQYITTICAVKNRVDYYKNSVNNHETVERSYVISATNSLEATGLAASKFWKEINPLSYTYVHQNTSLLTLEDLFG